MKKEFCVHANQYNYAVFNIASEDYYKCFYEPFYVFNLISHHLYSIPFRLMMVIKASVMKATSATASNHSHSLFDILTALHIAKALWTSNTIRTREALIIFTNNILLCMRL